jgi:hypothetical protein
MSPLILSKNSDVFADTQLNSLVCMCMCCNFTKCTLKFSDLTPKNIAIQVPRILVTKMLKSSD